MKSDKTSNHHSLINTLFIRFVLTSLGTAVIIFCILAYNLHTTRSTLYDRGLVSQANDIADAMATSQNGSIQLDIPDQLAQIYQDHQNDFAYVILNEAGKVILSSSGRDKPLYRVGPDGEEKRPSYFQITDPETGGKIMGATLVYLFHNEKFRIQVTQGPEHADVLTDSILEEFTETTAVIIMLLITVVWVFNMMTIHRALKPLKAASRLATNINPARLDVRLPEEHLPMEILPLVQAVNSALARLETGFQMQRDFTADAAHQLRTPLSILSARIDRLSADPEYPALKSDIRAMTRVVGQLLKVAQLEIFVLDNTEQADLSEICIDVAAEIGPLAIKQNKTISVLGAEHPVIVNGNTESLHHAILNLVENALNSPLTNGLFQPGLPPVIPMAINPLSPLSVTTRR